MNIKHFKQMCNLIFLLFALLLLLPNGHVWNWVEGLSLFIPKASYFQSFLNQPGGILFYLGCFLTQLLYYPLIGCMVFVALLFIVQRLTLKVFCLSDSLYPLTFLPSCMLLTSVLNMGYTWITLKSPGFFFTPTLGCCFFLLVLYFYQHLPYKFLRFTAVFLCLLFYHFMGFYALYAVGLCLFYEAKRQFSIHRGLLILLLGAITIYWIPRLFYYTMDNTEQEISRMYLAGMPTFFIRRAELMLWVPFLTLLAIYFFFSLSERLRLGLNIKRQKVSAILVCILCMSFTVSQTYRNKNFEASVHANLAMENEDWMSALKACRTVEEEPTRDVVINEKLALTMLRMNHPHRQLPPLKETYKDSRPGFVTFMQLCGLPMLYYMGQTNLCYRWGMEISVDYGWRSSCLKYMVRCALLNGEIALAQKYNYLLSQTWTNRKWAAKYQRFIEHPEQIGKDAEFSRIKALSRELPDMFIE